MGWISNKGYLEIRKIIKLELYILKSTKFEEVALKLRI